MKYLKLYISTAVLTLLMVVVFVGLKSSIVNAASCNQGGSFGAGLGYGYFSCANPPMGSENDVFPGQLTANTSASTFESKITSQLNSGGNSPGTTELSTGAAFIIDTMMGVPSGTCDRTVCDTTVAKWKDLVTTYGDLGLIKYNPASNWSCGITDTLYYPTINDDMYFTLEKGGSAIPCDSPGGVAVIEFLNPQTKTPIFNIKIDCGNPIGTLQALPPPQIDTISGSVNIKNLTTNTASSDSSVSVILNATSGIQTTKTDSGGRYSFSVPDGDHFTVAMNSATPRGDSGPYTDYGGAATFTGLASQKYNCGPTTYQLQVAATPFSTPDNTGRSGSAKCDTIGSNDNYNFIYTGVICSGPSCCTTSCGGGTPTFTCNAGSYDITPVVNPDTPYIGAGYPNSSITFNSSGNFESDSNNPYNDNLSQSVNQSSQLTVEATGTDNGLGITAPVTYGLSPGSSSVGPLAIQTPVGIYSVPYQVKIVNVVIDPNPSTHWAPVPNPNPTLEAPKAPSPTSYTNEATTVAAPVYTTVEAPGDPTTGYYTQEKTTTTYTYTKTTSTPGPTTYTCPSGWMGPSGTICYRYTLKGVYKTTAATPHPGSPIITTTTVATDYSYQYNYYITWVSTPNVECPPPVPVKVGYQPYMRVYGGDVMAGSTFDPGLTTACMPLSAQRSNIIGWNYDTPNYSGAGTEFAGYALGGIDGFVTSQRSSAVGTGLSFANTSNNSPSGGEFGGSFIPVNCAPDFYDAVPTSATSISGNVLLGNLSGAYQDQGNPLTITGGSVNSGRHVAIYVKNANVNIESNTTLGGTWNTVADIPSFELIVSGGNIFINGSVTRLDGLYVAQGGTIYDCSVNGAAASGSEFSNNCNNPLVINGAFIGTQVDLMRTPSSPNNTLYKSRGDALTSGGSDSASESGNASEVFNYSPAVWLGLTSNNWLSTNSNTTNLNNYNSITSLPPVL